MGAGYQRSAWFRRQRGPGVYVQFRNWNAPLYYRMRITAELAQSVAQKEPGVMVDRVYFEFYELPDPRASIVLVKVLGVAEDISDSTFPARFGHTAVAELRQMFQTVEFKFDIHDFVTPTQEA